MKLPEIVLHFWYIIVDSVKILPGFHSYPIKGILYRSPHGQYVEVVVVCIFRPENSDPQPQWEAQSVLL